MKQLKTQVPAGAWDYLPEECAAKRKIENEIRDSFLKNGYNEIETPSFEYYEVFMHDSVPYVQENMMKFFDQKGRILALRPDLTGPIARAAATKLLARQEVLRLCYIQNAFGFFNRGIAGKTEFTQAGVELIGKRGADADAEVIALAIGTLRKIGLDGFKIELGQVAYFKGLIEGSGLDEEQTERIRLLVDTKNNVELEYELSRLNMEASKKKALLELGGLFGGREALAKAEALAKSEECRKAVENIREVFDILCGFGYEDYLSIDFGILNNFNYYSGIIFRGISDGIGMPILSGGRYDELLREFGTDAPATGFAMGVKELLVVLERQGKLPRAFGKTMVIRADRNMLRQAFAYAQELRGQGKQVILELNGSAYDPACFEVVDFNGRAK
ncbi:ATP phosphoribosyltransferase regulatory subunit [Christensenella intestinihominis]|uniref:ATP phosphoribosyltransferase regulatory subunit n=1 Tax=Christensenella intestinihominis TaxID=1851429 RepID=UPI00082DB428|nr:ATP phosphoribosyltransferase regulatory subunit [Christensenella intestinihominis]